MHERQSTMPSSGVRATAADLHAAERALRGSTASESIVIEEVVNLLAALAAGVTVDTIYVPEGYKSTDDLDACGRVVTVAAAHYRSLFETTRVPRVFALARLPRSPTAKSVAERAGDLVVLDGVAGPGNIGSVVRLAAAYDAAAVLVLDAVRRDLYRRGVIRASAGAIFVVPVLTMRAAEFLAFCDRNQARMVVTSAHGGSDVGEVVRCDRRLAIVFGGETAGVSSVVATSAAVTLHIPTPGPVESLNLSSAVAITLFARHARR